MPTQVVQLDLAEPIRPVRTPGGYPRVQALVRHHGRPIGWIRLPPNPSGDVICRAIANQLTVGVWDSLRAGKPPQPTHQPPVSIVICTRDHPDQLARQLRSVAALRYPQHEVIVVDNAPRDPRTREVCARFGFVRYILEPRGGLDYARNTGWRNARHDIIAYTDDDACVDPHWLSCIAGNYADASVQCVMGLTVPYELATPAQEYFEMYGGMQRGFHRRVYRPGQWTMYYPLGSGHFGAGVNMTLRRSMLERLGGFDEALDVGSLTRGGGDLDIMARCIRAGGTLVYEPCAVVSHQHRRTMRQMDRLMYDYGYGFYAYLAKYARGDLELQNHAIRLMKAWFFTWGWGRLWRNTKDALRARPHFPVRFVALEMLGFLAGPRAYGRSVRRVRKAAGRSHTRGPAA